MLCHYEGENPMPPPTDFTDAEALEVMQQWIVGRLIPKEACLLIVREVETAVKGKMILAKTTVQRTRSFRARHAEAGRSEVRGIFLAPELHAKVKAYARKLRQKGPT